MNAPEIQVSGERIMEHIRYLSEGLGRRLAGTEAERQAATYVAEQFESIGLENIALQPFPVSVWEHQSASLEVLKPSARRVDCIPVAQGPSTPPEGIEGEIVYLETASAAHLAGKQLTGKIGLCLGFPVAAPESLQQFEQAGLAAVLFVDERYPFTWPVAIGIPASFTELMRIPMASISYMDAWQIVQSGGGRVRLDIQASIQPGQSHNVIAELPGSKEIIVLTAHVDSVAVGLGAEDDGSGTACLLEVSRALVNHPRGRTLRFVIAGAEEQLSEGARHYVWEVQNRDDIQLNINIDGVGVWLGENYAYVTGPASLKDYLEDKLPASGFIAQVKTQVSPFFDSFPFNVAGIPAITFHRENPSGRRFCHHSHHDTPAVLSPVLLAATAHAVAEVAADLAQRPLPFARVIEEAEAAQLCDYAQTFYNLPGGRLPGREA